MGSVVVNTLGNKPEIFKPNFWRVWVIKYSCDTFEPASAAKVGRRTIELPQGNCSRESEFEQSLSWSLIQMNVRTCTPFVLVPVCFFSGTVCLYLDWYMPILGSLISAFYMCILSLTHVSLSLLPDYGNSLLPDCPVTVFPLSLSSLQLPSLHSLPKGNIHCFPEDLA